MGGDIRVFGVGGAGCNAIDRLRPRVTPEVKCVAANTDAQALERHPEDCRLALGPRTTGGRGAGATPSVGFAAANESLRDVVEALETPDIVFVAAGLGGGTGTGAAPVVAHAARERGALTVGVVTLPFAFEGGRRAKVAARGLEALQGVVDTLLILPNDRLLMEAHADTTLVDAFFRSDEVLGDAVTSISDLVTRPGLINLDFADLRAVFRAGERGVMGLGEGVGEDRALDAVIDAMRSPLLSDDSIEGATRLLLSFTVDPRLGLGAVQRAAERAHAFVDDEADIFFGVRIDPSLTDEVKVTLVAAGLPFEPRPTTVEAPSGPGVSGSRPRRKGRRRNALVELTSTAERGTAGASSQ